MLAITAVNAMMVSGLAPPADSNVMTLTNVQKILQTVANTAIMRLEITAVAARQDMNWTAIAICAMMLTSASEILQIAVRNAKTM
jgi:hypothetical protein